MIKGIIFDLDNCILDTHALGEEVIADVLAALRSSVLPAEKKREIEEALWATSLEDLITQGIIPDPPAEAMRAAYRETVLPPNANVRSFGDEHHIRNLPVRKYLVTSGYRKFQQSKIDALGIEDIFEKVIIEGGDEPSAKRGKKNIFSDILKENGWARNEVLVVGDNPGSELRAAQELGIPMVQTLRPKVVRWDEATHHIRSLSELADLLQ